MPEPTQAVGWSLRKLGELAASGRELNLENDQRQEAA